MSANVYYKQLSDERYVELKVRTITLTNILIMLSIVIAFLGWNVRSNIISEVKKEITPEIGTLVPIYVVPDLRIVSTISQSTLYYKDMKPINANRLPIFEKPPIINISQTGRKRTIYINQVTKDYVNLTLGVTGESGDIDFTLWIVKR
jgi:hypothetical protein